MKGFIHKNNNNTGKALEPQMVSLYSVGNAWEVIDCLGWLRLFNKGEKEMPDDLRKSCAMPIYVNKGDIKLSLTNMNEGTRKSVWLHAMEDHQ